MASDGSTDMAALIALVGGSGGAGALIVKGVDWLTRGSIRAAAVEKVNAEAEEIRGKAWAALVEAGGAEIQSLRTAVDRLTGESAAERNHRVRCESDLAELRGKLDELMARPVAPMPGEVKL